MQNGLKIDGQMRSLAIALGGAIITSVIAMFIPTSVFEGITGSTGISELVPATGAPLGDTARAMIAFSFGAIAFAVLAGYLLRKPVKVAPARRAPMPVREHSEAVAAEASDAPSFMEKMRAKIGDYVESRRNADDVTELSDLPKLRAGDAHPDAPPRRPISAHRDFGEVLSDEVTEVPVVAVAEPVVAAPVVETPAVEVAREDIVQTAADPVTVANMVSRLELAVAERQDQLAKLEAVAAAEIAKPEVVAPSAIVDVEAAPETVVEEPRPMKLEAVPSEPANEPAKEPAGDEMDAALRSALETLHRMNVRTR